MSKKIGVLTSGGDCAGLNAALRAITHHATLTYGWRIFGIKDGTTGLINRPIKHQELTINTCDSQLLRAGGTILGTTNKDNPFSFPNTDGTFTDRSKDFAEGYHDLELDALIALGGDGSMRILRRLAQEGNINLVTIPKTIDNDLGLTEAAIGFSTATDVATEALDRLQPTAASHQRVVILEVMGRDAGHIALSAGISGGADIILIPEIPYSIEGISKKLKSLAALGKNFALVMVSEAVKTLEGDHRTLTSLTGRVRYGGIGQYLGDMIIESLQTETRVTVLGHLQRGGQPSAKDRLIASAFGVAAVDLIAQGKFDRMVAWHDRQVIDVSIVDAINTYQVVDIDGTLVRTAQGLGVYVGDVPNK